MAKTDAGRDGGRRTKSGVRKSTMYKGRGRGMTGPQIPMSLAEIRALAQGMGRGRGMTGVTPETVNDLALPMSFGDSNRSPQVKMNDFFAGTGYKPPSGESGGNQSRSFGDDHRQQFRPPTGADNPGTRNDGYSALDTLTELATSMLTQPGPTYDYESAMQEAAQGIRQAYGAEIAAIRQNNRVARKSTKRARNEIENMYKGLQKIFGVQENQARRRGEKTSEKQMGIAEEGNTFLTDLNNQMIQDEAALLQNLNAGQAAPEVLSPDFDRMASQVSENTEMGQEAASRAIRQGENNARWFDRSQGGAALEGTNRSADMLSQLAAFVNANRGEIAGLKGQRAADVAASNASIEAQAAQAQGDAQQQTWDNVMELLGMTAGIEDTNFDNKLDARDARWDRKMDRRRLNLDERKLAASQQEDIEGPSTPLDEALSVIAAQQDPNDQKAANALLKLTGRPAWRTGKIDLGNGQEANLTPYEARARAHQMGMRLGLRGRQLADFVKAAEVSLG